MTPNIRHTSQRLLGATAATLTLLASTASAQQFNVTGSMSVTRSEPATTVLNDGTVLVVGGLRPATASNPTKAVLNTAELYDPVTGTFHLTTGTLNRERFGATATLLNNGKVLIAGGYDFSCDGSGNDCFLKKAELYDPSTQTFALTGDLHEPLYHHTATLLADGTVLIAGGYNDIPSFDTTFQAEIYDPSSGTFRLLSAHLNFQRAEHTASLLNSGKVLIAGGGSHGLWQTAELYDPATETFSTTGNLTTARAGHTATTLTDGRVLIAGGQQENVILSSAELYNPLTELFDPAEHLIEARAAHAATRLSDGTVLVVGGIENGVPNGGDLLLASAEIYNPAGDEFTRIAMMNQRRINPSATLLPSGQVLVAGGDVIPDLSSAELFQPATNPFALLAGNNTFSGNQTVNGNVSATSFIGNGAGLTGVNASMLGGIGAGMFARRDTSNLFTGNQTVNGSVTATSFFGDGSGLTGVSAVFASSAADSQMLGGIAANRYARLDIANAFTGDQSVTGNVSTTGTVRIGGGTPIVEHLSRAFTLSVPVISPGNCNLAAITVAFPGAADGDTLALGISNAMTSAGALTYFAWVSAANAVSFRVCNPRGPSNALLTGSVRVDIWKH